VESHENAPFFWDVFNRKAEAGAVTEGRSSQRRKETGRLDPDGFEKVFKPLFLEEDLIRVGKVLKLASPASAEVRAGRGNLRKALGGFPEIVIGDGWRHGTKIT
jgi:hypothetical protein